MNSRIFKMTYLSLLLIAAWTSQTTATNPSPPIATPNSLTSPAFIEFAPDNDSFHSLAAAAEVDFSLIFGNFIILCLYSFPMSFAENWAISDPKKTKNLQNSELPDALASTGKPTQKISIESPSSFDQQKTLNERFSHWAQELPRVPAGLAAGGCVMIATVVLGAVAFAFYYFFTDQPEKVSQIIPWFAYWFPFALLGMVTDVPFTFRIFDLENRRRKVLLRLIVWWFPRLIIFIFMFNLPVVRDLDPLTTALVVLAIDIILTAFFLGLHNLRERTGMKAV